MLIGIRPLLLYGGDSVHGNPGSVTVRSGSLEVRFELGYDAVNL